MNHIYPDEDLRRWEWCDNSVILANADYYYTKEQTEELIDSVSGLSPSEVQAMINGSIHTKADKEYVDEKVTSLSADMRSNQAQINQRYTKTETINLINQATSGKQDTLIAGENITISGNVISSTAKGDITSGEVESMIAEAVSGKQDTLIAGENITIVDNVISSVGGGVTSGEVESMITEAVSGKADTSTVEALGGVLTAHTANNTIHITEAERTAWNAKSDFSGDYNDLTNKPTNVSSFNNDAGYLTEHQSLSAYSTTVEMNNAIDAAVSGKADSTAVTQDIAAATDDMATMTWVGEQGYLTEHQSLSAYSTTQEMNQAISASTSGKVETTAFTAYSGATDARITEDEEVTAAAFNILNSRKQDKVIVSGTTLIFL